MGRIPKVENCKLRPEIDQLLLQGNTYKYIEKWCIDRGLRISHTSIQRYAERNFPELRATVDMKPDPESETLQDMTDNPFVIPLQEVKNSKEFDTLVIEKLRNTTAFSACILENKMREHALGNTKYPKDEIAGFEKLIAMHNMITAKPVSERGQTIFDLEKALADKKRTFLDDLAESMDNYTA